MSAGVNALRGVIDTQSVTAFRMLREEWFLDNEVELYRFIRDHFRRYGQLPDLRTCQENSFNPKPIRQPVQYYIDRVSERAIYNAVNNQTGPLMDAMRDKNMEAVKGAVRAMLNDTRVAENRQDYSTFSEQLDLIQDDYTEAKRHPGLQGVTLGYDILDEITNGGQPGDVYFILGRPGIGKSWKILQMMRKAWKAGRPVGGISMEMTSRQLSRRLIGMEAGLNPDLIRKGQLSSSWGEPLFQSTVEAAKGGAPLHFLEGNFRKTVGDLDDFVQEFNPDILYIDAGYLLTPETVNKNFSRRDYVTAVVREIKGLATDRRIPIVVSAQLNREAKKNTKQLDVSHAAETDAIGQDASLVIAARHGKAPYEETTREYQIIKNREGPVLNYQAHFKFNPMNFEYIAGSESVQVHDREEDNQEGPRRDNNALRQDLGDMESAGWSR